MKKLAFISMLVACTGAASAATVSVSAGFGATSGIIVQNAAGVALASPYYFAVGAFETAPVITDLASLQTALSNYIEFGETVTAGVPPKIAGSFTRTTNRADFDTRLMYFLVGNGTTQANSTEFAFFTFTGSPNSFPADISQTGGPSITLANVTNTAIVGTAGSEIDNATGPDVIRLVAVAIPEPSAALLGAVGALGLLRRRRN